MTPMGHTGMQTDRPGIIAAVSSVLAKGNVNISFMTLTRYGRGQDAIMALGLDDKPDQVRPCGLLDGSCCSHPPLDVGP